MYHVAFQPLPWSGITRDDVPGANVVRLVKDFVASIPSKIEAGEAPRYVEPGAPVRIGMMECARLLMTGGALAGLAAAAPPAGAYRPGRLRARLPVRAWPP